MSDLFTNTPQTIADRNQRFWDHRLRGALKVALEGQTALVIVPPAYPKQAVLTALVRLTPEDRKYLIRTPGNELHFEGTRGSVRVFSSDHVEYNTQQKRVMGYPAGIPLFIHPRVEDDS